MKIAIFSDVHGNLYAFEEVYKRLQAEACDAHFFLGDVCGYYYHQNEIIEMLKTLPRLEALLGNHDVMFMMAMEDSTVMKSYTGNFGRSFSLFKESITPESLAFLREMQSKIVCEEHAVAGFHGSPWNPFHEYIYPDSPTHAFSDLPYGVVFLGHTHHVMDRREGDVRIVNPGSCGQPRDGGWPSYAVYDSDTKDIRIERVPYNIDYLVDDVKRHKDKNPYLISVLERIGA